MTSSFPRLLRTIYFLKPVQIFYQLKYRLFPAPSIKRISKKLNSKVKVETSDLVFDRWIEKPISLNHSYSFLNQAYIVQYSSDLSEKSRLWQYNFMYMDYLLQPEMDKKTGSVLILKFSERFKNIDAAFEPYPVSLRGINWIKFILLHKILEGNIHQKELIINDLYSQYLLLLKRPEYNLLGNHLLENGISLLFGGLFFNSSLFYSKAKSIITQELTRQILDDGAHYELSPMYHQIILDRLLDCVNLLKNNKVFMDQDQLLDLITKKASRMLVWINNISFSYGRIPHFSDSTYKIAPTTAQLNEYALRLGLFTDQELAGIKFGCTKRHQTESGYYQFQSDSWECIMDAGHTGPDYQPGHAHADTFTFVLNLNEKPLIVDTGVSTYEKNARRLFERGTAAHNTVQVNDTDSSEVWSGFRMGRRARVTVLHADEKSVVASHNGYRHFGIIHERELSTAEDVISIQDRLKGGKKYTATSRFHFHPEVEISQKENSILFNGGSLTFKDHDKISIKDYLFSRGFNDLITGKVVEVTFQGSMQSNFNFS